MLYFSEEEIAEARKVDLLSYLEKHEPSQLVCESPGCYTTRDHDSLKISHGKWMWWSRGFGGYSALDYLVKVRGMPFKKAIATILGCDKTAPPESDATGSDIIGQDVDGSHQRKLLLPTRNKTNTRVFRYLVSRGIHPDLVRLCIEKDLIYESLPYHNVIFVGYDEAHTPRYAYYRSTGKERIMGEAIGSDKRYSFRIDRDDTVLHVFESAIDLLSYATVHKIWTCEWLEESMLSLGGVFVPSAEPERMRLPRALENKLKVSPDIRSIRLHLDCDKAGAMASENIIKQLSSSYDIEYVPPKFGKDVNDELRFLLSVSNK